MFPRARRDTPFLALLIGVVVAAVPASARSNGVPRNDRDPYMALLETGVRSDVDPLPRPDRQTPPLGPTAPTTALRPEACGPKPVAFLPDLARRPHDPLCTGDPATMPARCIDAQREMHWDEEDRLASVHGSDADMEFRYDADGERTHRVSLRRHDVTQYASRFHSIRNGQFAMDHVFAGSERVATVMFNVPPAGGPGCDPTTGRTCTVTHLPPGGGPPGTIGSPRTTLWYHTDHLQSTNYVTDARGRVTEHLEYFPFGEQWVEEQSGASSDTVPYRFTGHDWDSETRLYYAGARYYDPRQGQWLGADPARRGGLAGNGHPNSFELYGYGHNNPLLLRDPDGADPQSCFTGGVCGAAATQTAQRMLLPSRIGAEPASYNWENRLERAYRAGIHGAERMSRIPVLGLGARALVGGTRMGEALTGESVAGGRMSTTQRFGAGISGARMVLGAMSDAASLEASAPSTETPAAMGVAGGAGGTAASAFPSGGGVYQFPDQSSPGQDYVGETEDFQRRLPEHQRSGRLLPGTEVTTPVPGGRVEREIAEHQRIQQLTGGVPARQSPVVSNRRDPIGPNRRHLLPGPPTSSSQGRRE